MHIDPDPNHVFLIRTTQDEFLRALTRFVGDVLSGRENSRTLNSADDMRSYFSQWPEDELPRRTQSAFPVSTVISPSYATEPIPEPQEPSPRGQRADNNVLPKKLKVKFGARRLGIIKDELSRLKRKDFPNAGIVLLRVFFELMIRDYFERTGEMETIKSELKDLNKLPQHGEPEMRHLVPRVREVAKKRLEKSQAGSVNRALSKGGWIEDLNAFVHQPQEIPTPDNLLQFWERTAPLFRLMLEQPVPTEGDGEAR